MKRRELKGKAVSGTMLILLFLGILPIVFYIHPIRAEPGTIYIRADGSIDPPTANITTVDNGTYTFTADIYDEIVVERSNIIVDGNGHTLNGSWSLTYGFDLTSLSNVTIKNTNIEGFYTGIHFNSSCYCTVFENNVTNNGRHGFGYGIWLKSSFNNSISGNNITNNHYAGIWNELASNNSLSNNNIVGNKYGIYLLYSSNNVISGNNITDSYWSGVRLLGSSNVTVSGNNIGNNGEGLTLYRSNYTCLSENALRNNGFSIMLEESNHNTISGNNITASNDVGIYFSVSSNNIFRSNNMTDNTYGFEVMVGSLQISDFMNDVDASNTIDGKPVYYWINKSNKTIPMDAGYVVLANCTRITVQNLNLTRNGQGILLGYTTNSRITNNNVTNNKLGIHLFWSSNNTLSENNITNNQYWGIQLGPGPAPSNYNSIIGNNIANNNNGLLLGQYSSNNSIIGNNIANGGYGVFLGGPNTDNVIYHNNFVNNYHQVYFQTPGYANFWDDGYPSGGNYWSNYVDVDQYSGSNQDQLGSDGIWDHPYVIDESNQDNYPLTSPWSEIPEDTTPPTIGIPSLTPYGDILPDQEVKISVNVTDVDSGVEDVTLSYTINNGSLRTDLLMSYNSSTGLYEATIPGQPAETLVEYQIIAYDNAGNPATRDGTEPYCTYQVIPEFPPFLILPLFVIVTLAAVVFAKKRRQWKILS